jgi:hypothetical protein
LVYERLHKTEQSEVAIYWRARSLHMDKLAYLSRDLSPVEEGEPSKPSREERLVNLSGEPQTYLRGRDGQRSAAEWAGHIRALQPSAA